MESNLRAIKRFYRSDRWKIARAIKIASACGMCEKCGKPGTEVHHKIHLTPDNVSDPEISVNQENLLLLCKDCHNKEHGRFTTKKEVYFDDLGNFKKI
ncbi:MAG: HNH endonuclease [Bacilli bacterium]|nr:HNH endonuclease [Bacilli bacterium]